MAELKYYTKKEDLVCQGGCHEDNECLGEISTYNVKDPDIIPNYGYVYNLCRFAVALLRKNRYEVIEIRSD